MNLSCVVLAGGLGTRMKSAVPKVLHKVCGFPMLQAVVATARKLNPDRIIVVAGKDLGLIREEVAGSDIVFALQEEPKGTGHALRCARPLLKNVRTVIVLSGDTPLLGARTLKKFLHLHRREGNALSVLSFRAANPHAYGRIVRDGSGKILSIVEESDADELQRRIDEVNGGVYAINDNALDVLNSIKINRAKGEYYLTDIVAAAVRRGLGIEAYCIGSEEELLGVNTRRELYTASRLMKKRIIDHWIDRGVLFLDTDSVFIHPEVSIGRETTIYPNVYLEGQTKIGKNSVIYPNVRIRNSIIGRDVVIKDSSVIEDSRVRDRASVGPFARIRPASEIGREARIGNFVEVKSSVIGAKTKASHLSYLGDAVIGGNVNIGAGAITCNYDGVHKRRTLIEDDVFIGSDAQLVAPVRIGRGAYVGAGSTITHDVPPLSLAVSRARQRNIEDWARKRQLKMKNEKVKGEKRTAVRKKLHVVKRTIPFTAGR